MKILVTRPANVREETDGSIELINPDAIGYVGETHIFPISIAHPETGEQLNGLKTLIQVFWELERSPACTFEVPEDLYWLRFLLNSDVAESQDKDSDEASDDQDTDEAEDASEQVEDFHGYA